MTTYHVLIDYDETSIPRIVLLDREPVEWSGRDLYRIYTDTYYVYCIRDYPSDLLPEIGRAIERKERE